MTAQQIVVMKELTVAIMSMYQTDGHVRTFNGVQQVNTAPMGSVAMEEIPVMIPTYAQTISAMKRCIGAIGCLSLTEQPVTMVCIVL